MKQSRTSQAIAPRHIYPKVLVRKSVPYLAVLVLIILPLLASLQMALKLSFSNGQLIVGGIPASIIATFLQDDMARNAYLNRDRQLLHDRLQALGVEEEIKDFYRSQIPDKVELDQYIHQLFYDRTGYVGENYRVNSEGVLVLKKGRLYRVENDLP